MRDQALLTARCMPCRPPIAGRAPQLRCWRLMGHGVAKVSAACGHPAIAASERVPQPSIAPASPVAAPSPHPRHLRPERWPDALPASARDQDRARHHVSAGRTPQGPPIAQAGGHPALQGPGSEPRPCHPPPRTAGCAR